MKLPNKTRVYIHSSIGSLHGKNGRFCMVGDWRYPQRKHYWNVKESKESGWYVLEIYMPGKMTPEREEFFINLAEAIDWDQHYCRSTYLQIL